MPEHELQHKKVFVFGRGILNNFSTFKRRFFAEFEREKNLRCLDIQQNNILFNELCITVKAGECVVG